jgi:hypothetical protein
MVDEKYSGMLDLAVWVKQQGTDSANVGDQGLGSELSKPLRFAHLDIIIEKEQKLTGASTRSRVVKPRPVERLVPLDNLQAL